MGLLNYITAHSMDEDYAQVAERSAPRERAGAARSGLAALLVLGLFGLLVATAAVQTSRTASVSADAHDSLVRQIQGRTAQLDRQRAVVAKTRSQIAVLQERYLQTTGEGRAVQTTLRRLGVSAGSLAVRGPGVRVVVDDSDSGKWRVLDKDLQRLVNGLWQSGAEAISINGQRLSNLSAIRVAGSAITVNFKRLSPPYQVLAIGNRNQIPARFVETAGGSYWLDIRSLYGLKFTMSPEESLKLPAADHLSLRHAETLEPPL